MLPAGLAGHVNKLCPHGSQTKLRRRMRVPGPRGEFCRHLAGPSRGDPWVRFAQTDGQALFPASGLKAFNKTAELQAETMPNW
jgi:hypothetical protein